MEIVDNGKPFDPFADAPPPDLDSDGSRIVQSVGSASISCTS